MLFGGSFANAGAMVDKVTVTEDQAAKIDAETKAAANEAKASGTSEVLGETKLSNLPENVQNSYNSYSKNGWQGNYKGQTPGTQAGGKWYNLSNKLPRETIDGEQITYKEFDVNSPTGEGRDAQRFLLGSDGKTYYTDNHYSTFKLIK